MDKDKLTLLVPTDQGIHYLDSASNTHLQDQLDNFRTPDRHQDILTQTTNGETTIQETL